MELRLVIGVLGFLAASSWISAPTRAAGLPPSEDMAKARLNGSPRHAELATVDVRGAPVRVWVVYPERKDAAPAVIVIHEIFGLTAWIRAVADQLAAEGFIAVAPDLLSGKGPAGGGTEAYPSRDDVTKAVSGLNGLLDYGPMLWAGTALAGAIAGYRWWSLRRGPRP